MHSRQRWIVAWLGKVDLKRRTDGGPSTEVTHELEPISCAAAKHVHDVSVRRVKFHIFTRIVKTIAEFLANVIVHLGDDAASSR